MDELAVSAASGMRARLESLEMLANNLANSATAGYKLDREFYSLYTAPEAIAESDSPATLPVIERHWTDFRQGTLLETGSPLNAAISGKGFFTADGPKGPLYTRNGSFRLSAAGVLTTLEGYAVRSTAGTPIQATSQEPLEIAPDGSIRQAGQLLGTLAVADFGPAVTLGKFGQSYFIAPGGARPASGYAIHQGKLEASNVSAPESAVRLIGLMRQFEMLQKAVGLGADMGRRAIEEVARVTP